MKCGQSGTNAYPRVTKFGWWLRCPCLNENACILKQNRMQLDMKTRCEKCGDQLAADGEAFICSYECTFCSPCSADALGVCPHCAGELIRRPRRATAAVAADVRPAENSVVRPSLVWGLSFAVWTLVAFAATCSIYELYRSTGGAMRFRDVLGLEFSQVLAYAPITPLVFFLSTRYPFQRRKWLRYSLVYLAGGLLFSLAHIALRGITPYAVWDPKLHSWTWAIWNSQTHSFQVRWPVFRTLFWNNVVDDITGTYAPIVLIAHAVSYYRKLRDRERQTSQLETQLTKAHLRALKSQLQPHFLFNTMHSISALMLTDVPAADRMMTRLSDLLRMSLENDGVQVTRLSRELEFVTGYLEIEKVRFGERLGVTLDIVPETLDAQVPHLLLQPLVENAVRHGVARLSANGKLRIAATHDGRSLLLAIRDNGPGLGDSDAPGAKAGLGLRATRERLQTLYGGDQSLHVRNLPEGGVEVSVRIPFQLVPDDYERNFN
jgi:two-component system, LytTR family, sensor kinase